MLLYFNGGNDEAVLDYWQFVNFHSLYFSYEKGSLAQIFPLSADEVREIQAMNRRGEKPETLKQEVVAAPEFIDAVGDDAINRFDPEKRKRRRNNKNRNRNRKDKPQNA